MVAVVAGGSATVAAETAAAAGPDCCQVGITTEERSVPATATR